MKIKKITAIAAAAVICVSAFAVGCSVSTYEQYCYAMGGTPASLVLTANFNSKTEKKANELWQEAQNIISDIEQSVSVSVSSSYVNAFNTADAGERVQIDEICYNILSLAVDVYNLTGGSYNPAVYYSVDLYGFASRLTNDVMPYDRQTAESELPETKYITAFQELSQGFADIVLQSVNGEYYVTKPQKTVEVDGVTYSLKIDLGGIGKGYAADCINALIDDYGFEYGYFNFGSSSIAVKGSYDGEDGNWNLDMRNPRWSSYSDYYYLTVPVSNVCLSTSGDYVQYYEIDGVRYCHIIDPATGSPVQTGILTATVIGGSAAEDDALTTAVMVMGLQKAVEFINENLNDRIVVFVYESGENYYVISNSVDILTINAEGYSFGNTVDGDGNIVLNNDVA